MRRRQNQDLEKPLFQQELPDLLCNLGQLQPTGSWSCKTQLMEEFTRASRKAIHDPLTDLRAKKDEFTGYLAKVASTNLPEPSADMPLMREHIKAAFQKGSCYALRGCVIKDAWSVFRLVHLSPGNNMYLQKACHLSSDVQLLQLAGKV